MLRTCDASTLSTVSEAKLKTLMVLKSPSLTLKIMHVLNAHVVKHDLTNAPDMPLQDLHVFSLLVQVQRSKIVPSSSSCRCRLLSGYKSFCLFFLQLRLS
jgi:hypothetical protein